MKAKLTLENGKTIEMELTNEQAELINQSDKSDKKRTGYERVIHGDTYYSSDNSGLTNDNTSVNMSDYIGDYIDNSKYDNADYYNDETLTKNTARADTLMRRFRRFAVENGGSFSNEEWLGNNDINKYYIEFNYYNNELNIDDMVNCKDFGQIYFRSEEIAQKAINTFKEDLIWYFQEYEDMLR